MVKVNALPTNLRVWQLEREAYGRGRCTARADDRHRVSPLGAHQRIGSIDRCDGATVLLPAMRRRNSGRPQPGTDGMAARKKTAPTRAAKRTTKRAVKRATKGAAKSAAKSATRSTAKQAAASTKAAAKQFPPAAKRRAAIPSAASKPARPSDPRPYKFDPRKLDRTVIALPLVERFKEKPKAKEGRGTKKLAGPSAEPKYAVVIDLNLDYHDGRDAARKAVIADIVSAVRGGTSFTDADRAEYAARLDKLSPLQYVAAKLTERQIIDVVRHDVDQANNQWNERRIYRVWPDFEVSATLNKSTQTVKADAARIAFNARGRDIVWAVMDSGIDKTHPHFTKYRNLDVREPVRHDSFVDEDNSDPLVDDFGHGTHVAGIIAGCLQLPEAPPAATAPKARNGKGAKVKVDDVAKAKAEEDARKVYSAHGVREEQSDVRRVDIRPVTELAGVAPECKIVSMKVLDSSGNGTTTAIIRALQRVNEVNQFGRRLLIHGVNLSLGYDFDPEWFACGQSPLCVEVDRLVRSGVVVVVAAGNSGYGFQQTSYTGVKAAGIPLTINDPGNAESAITVGSTHKEMPHLYGASFFSSKGPTGDGRNKPDLLAPGEKIVSCAAGAKKAAMLEQDKSSSSPRKFRDEQVQYIEDSGTSMAAPHVSGAIAAFLSVRREFQGQPERVKQLFMDNATDLNRDRYWQGRGLVDLMRTIQSV